MIIRKLVVLVLGFALALLSLDSTLAISSESQKQGAETEKKVIGTPPPAKEKMRANLENKKKGAADRFFKDLDGDKDNKVSPDEFLAPMKIRFKSIDSNQDGFITREEFENYFEKRQKMRMKSMQKHPGGTMPNKKPPQMPPK